MGDLIAQLGTSGLIAICGAIGTFYVLRSRVAEMGKALEKSNAEDSAQWAKLDDIHSRLMVFENRLKVISTMLQPEKLADHSAWKATVDTEMKYLRRDVDKVRAK